MPMHDDDTPIPEVESPQPAIMIPISGIMNWWEEKKQRDLEEFKRQNEIYERIIRDGKSNSDFQRD